MKCEFCGQTRRLKIRANNRVICDDCWQQRVSQCQAAIERRWRGEKYYQRCSNNTINPNGLCYYHQDRQPTAWQSCIRCKRQIAAGTQCWRCRIYGEPK